MRAGAVHRSRIAVVSLPINVRKMRRAVAITSVLLSLGISLALLLHFRRSHVEIGMLPPSPLGLSTGLQLGDSETVMIEKMRRANARDVSAATESLLHLSIIGEQRTYWWEMSDRAIVGVNLAGAPNETLRVNYIEVGEPNHGVAGIRHWRSQNLKTITDVRKP